MIDWRHIYHDLCAGTIGGVSGIIAGHPIDTIKVRLQTTSIPLWTVLRTLSTDGVNGFYKGMLSPIVSNAPINAILFATYGSLSRMFLRNTNHENIQNNHSENEKNIRKLNKRQQFIAGSTAGAAQTIFATPAELVKIQVQSSSTPTNSIIVGRSIVHQFGVAGLYRGWTITAARDIPSFGVYFVMYDVIKGQLISNNSSKTEMRTSLMIAGGLTGMLSWGLCQPLDVAKSCYQALPLDSTESIISVCKTRVNKEGWRFFTKGMSASILRAFPTSAVTFLVYEETMAALVDEEE